MIQELPRYEDYYLYILAQLAQRLEIQGVEGDRTGTGTARMFGTQLRADLRNDFPLLTTKKVFTRGIIEELLWFLRGETNIQSLVDKGVHIWDEWADDTGELGPVYGAQWRDWNEEGIDQIADLIHELKTNPNSRRMIVSAWNPSVIPDPAISPAHNVAHGRQALPPCHTMWQCFAQEMTEIERIQWVSDNHRDSLRGMNHDKLTEAGVPTHWLDLQLYQRSADWMLGVPFNAVSYSLLTMILAHHVGMAPRYFIHTFGDFHLYSNHLDQAKEQISRDPVGKQPKVQLLHDPSKPLDQLEASDFKVIDYHPHPAIKAPVSV